MENKDGPIKFEYLFSNLILARAEDYVEYVEIPTHTNDYIKAQAYYYLTTLW